MLLATLLPATLAHADPPAPPPAALACVAELYAATPVFTPAGWAIELPSGLRFRWDDGVEKDADARLAHPDLQDTLVPPYPRGPIAAVATPGADPGRARVEPFLDAVYGASAAAVQAHLVPVRFVGQEVNVHARIAEPLARVSARLEAALAATPELAPFVTGTLGGTFAWRTVVNTTRRSAHSWGAAVDIATARTTYWEWDRAAGRPITWANQVPEAVVAAFEAEGFIWGGRWYHYDTMHFEYRQEVLACGDR